MIALRNVETRFFEDGSHDSWLEKLPGSFSVFPNATVFGFGNYFAKDGPGQVIAAPWAMLQMRHNFVERRGFNFLLEQNVDNVNGMLLRVQEKAVHVIAFKVTCLERWHSLDGRAPEPVMLAAIAILVVQAEDRGASISKEDFTVKVDDLFVVYVWGHGEVWLLRGRILHGRVLGGFHRGTVRIRVASRHMHWYRAA
jgi:hypothetical protein